MKPYALILSLFSGILLTFSFAPFYVSWLAPLSLALFFSTWNTSSQAQALLRGLLFGIGFYGIGVSWVAISMHTYGGANFLVSFIFTALLVLILAILPAAQAVLYVSFFQRPILKRFYFPISWVFFEWLRTHAFTGFPWILLGVSQVPSSLAGYASISNVYFASLATATVASLLVYYFEKKTWHHRSMVLCAIALIYGAGYLALKVNTKSYPLHLQVSLVQGNIDQLVKWNPNNLPSIAEEYERLSKPTLGKSQLIVWPEDAIPYPWPDNIQLLSPFFHQLAAHHTSLLFGTLVLQHQQYYNAMILKSAQTQFYLKRHLVPWGEYVPFASLLIPIFNWLNFPASTLQAGPQTPTVLTVARLRIAPFICYEITYPNLMPPRNTIDLLVTINDDGWFGHSLAASQHLESAQMASIVTHRPQLFVSNTGITAVINAAGQVVQQLPRDQPGVLTTQL